MRTIARRLLAGSRGYGRGGVVSEFGSLAAREQPVAQLVADGQTNVEIAAAPFLRPRRAHAGNMLGYQPRINLATEAAEGRLPGADPQERAPA